MTNKDRYRTPYERNEAFEKFCKSKASCRDCQLYNTACMSKKPHNCKFAWLYLEAEDKENKSDKVVLTNEEKYKSVEEQTKAYANFCSRFDLCSSCPAYKYKVSCDLVWLTLKADEEGEKNHD